MTVLNKADRENSLKRCHVSKEWELREQTTRIPAERIPGGENSGCKSSEAGNSREKSGGKKKKQGAAQNWLADPSWSLHPPNTHAL